MGFFFKMLNIILITLKQDSKESTCNAGDMGLILGWGRYPKEGNGNLLKYLAWEIPQTENVASYSP